MATLKQKVSADFARVYFGDAWTAEVYTEPGTACAILERPSITPDRLPPTATLGAFRRMMRNAIGRAHLRTLASMLRARRPVVVRVARRAPRRMHRPVVAPRGADAAPPGPPPLGRLLVGGRGRR